MSIETNRYRLEIVAPMKSICTRRLMPSKGLGKTLGDVFPGDGGLGDTFPGDGPLGGSYFVPDEATLRVGMGYHCDIPDHRDFTLKVAKKRLTESHATALQYSYLFGKNSKRSLKPVWDLRPVDRKAWMPENQGPLHSCTAHAVVGLIEFMLLRATKEAQNLSRLFLYKSTRSLMRTIGDSGATQRATFRAVQTFGIPPEDYWRYDLSMFDVEPDAFLYSFSDHYQSLIYTRLDDYGLTGLATRDAVKHALCDGLPVVFGFPVYSSVGMQADIPLPKYGDRMVGGHAVLAVGYDDNHRGRGKGSIIFRNSWGPLWGENGYGYLPYEYIERQWALDFWTVFRKGWLNSKKFGDPVMSDNES